MGSQFALAAHNRLFCYGMVTNPSIAYMREAGPLLGINNGPDESDTTIQLLFWKAMYEHTAVHVGQLHAAFERLVTGGDGASDGDDLALFLDPFLTGRPVDIIAHLRANRSPALPDQSSVSVG